MRDLIISLASVEIRDGDLPFNLAAMRRAAEAAKRKGADLCCFGECALQGFNCLSWQFDTDRKIAVSTDSAVFRTVCGLSGEIGIDLLFGFIELDGDVLYSSCALIRAGELSHLYRRISKGWKEFRRTDGHYREGEKPQVFEYRGRRCLIALCGDLWDEPAESFPTDANLLFWPVYVCFTPEEWEKGDRDAYADKAKTVCSKTLLVNSVCRSGDDPDSFDAFGGSAYFENGQVSASLPMGEEGILTVSF